MSRVSRPGLSRMLVSRQMDTLVEVWRLPPKVNGKGDKHTLFASNVPMQILAATEEDRVEAADEGTSGLRVTHIGRCVGTTDIQRKDEVRVGGEKYKVHDARRSSESVQLTCKLELVTS